MPRGRALACLENVVHRSGEGLNNLFTVMRIAVPDELLVEELTLADLPPDWQPTSAYARCQPLERPGTGNRQRPCCGCPRPSSPTSITTC
ncbi:MAG: hypothetical protein WKG07_19795 [Hymenobacter sp.]